MSYLVKIWPVKISPVKMCLVKRRGSKIVGQKKFGQKVSNIIVPIPVYALCGLIGAKFLCVVNRESPGHMKQYPHMDETSLVAASRHIMDFPIFYHKGKVPRPQSYRPICMSRNLLTSKKTT